MSLHQLAKHLAAHGRDEDTVLVHMTPGEVKGLQQLAVAHGGTLTINPHTGLPEAGFLKSLLPMLAGAVATFFTAGAAAPWMAALAGAATGAATGDKNQSLLMRMGLGALSGFGGGSLAAGLAKAGAGAVGNQAVKTGAEQGVKTAAGNVATKVGTGAVANAVGTAGSQEALLGSMFGGAAPTAATPVATATGSNVAKNIAANNVAKNIAAKQVAKTVGTQALSKTPTGLAAIKAAGAGTMRLGSEAGRNAIAEGMFMQSPKLAAAAMALPAGMAASEVKPLGKNNEVQPEYQMFTYNNMVKNPNWKPGNGEPYFVNQGFSGPTVTKTNPFAPVAATYDKKHRQLTPAGPAPMDAVMAARNMGNQYIDQNGMPVAHPAAINNINDYINNVNSMQPPEFNAADGGGVPGLGDYISNVNSMGAAPTQPYKAPYATDNRYMGNRFEGTFGPFSGGLGLGMNAFSGSGYGMNYNNYNPSTGRFSYAAGGRLLEGPGDGVSDSIPAEIENPNGPPQKARLSAGEFVIPSMVVAKLGNFNNKAGAQKLMDMVARIEALPTPRGKDLKADRFMPA